MLSTQKGKRKEFLPRNLVENKRQAVGEWRSRMEYSIRELSELAGVSARTLRYYDEIGLLKPSRTSDAGYRFYGEKEVELLQQILFYRERGIELEQIAQILRDPEFDIRSALEEHLLELEQRKRETERLIQNIRQTIASMEGEYEMSDKERFEAFKKKQAEENERMYGEELRRKYGEEAVEESNRKRLKMNEEEYKRYTDLEQDILKRLEQAAAEGLQPDSEELKAIVELHREWLMMVWSKYTKEAHIGVGKMYVADGRFRKYYDRRVEGCADLLSAAIQLYCQA